MCRDTRIAHYCPKILIFKPFFKFVMYGGWYRTSRTVAISPPPVRQCDKTLQMRQCDSATKSCKCDSATKRCKCDKILHTTVRQCEKTLHSATVNSVALSCAAFCRICSVLSHCQRFVALSHLQSFVTLTHCRTGVGQIINGANYFESSIWKFNNIEAINAEFITIFRLLRSAISLTRNYGNWQRIVKSKPFYESAWPHYSLVKKLNKSAVGPKMTLRVPCPLSYLEVFFYFCLLN